MSFGSPYTLKYYKSKLFLRGGGGIPPLFTCLFGDFVVILHVESSIRKGTC